MLFYANPYFAIILIIALKIIVTKFPPLYSVLDQVHKHGWNLSYLFTSPLFWLLIFLTNVAYVCLFSRIIGLQPLGSRGFLTTTILLTLVNGIAVGWYHYSPGSLTFGYYFVFLAALLLQTVGLLITYLGFLKFSIPLVIFIMLCIIAPQLLLGVGFLFLMAFQLLPLNTLLLLAGFLTFLARFWVRSSGFLITYPTTGMILLGFLNFLIAWIILIGLTFFIWSSSISYR